MSKKPLDNPEVEVGADPVDPRRDDHWDYAEGVEKELRERVERSLGENEGDGAGAQINGAKEHLDEAAEEVDGGKVKELIVHIREYEDDGTPRDDIEIKARPDERE
jgi:hypothetical protein